MSDWKFELEDLEDAPVGEGGDGEASESGEQAASTARRIPGPIEPGDPSPENIAFVILGVAAAVLVFVQLLL